MSDQIKILIVDDDYDIRDGLVRFLSRQEFFVQAVADVNLARHAINDNSWDLVLLDIMMPGSSGLTLCQELFAMATRPSVILVSARSETQDRIIGLRAGADDYLSKPFDTQELLERIRAVLRRTENHQFLSQVNIELGSLYRFDRWTLAVDQRLLTRDDDVVFALGKSELDLLLAFLQRPGIILSRDRLMTLVGTDESKVFDRSIDSRISRIRKKLERDPRRASLIRTMRGDGYLLDAKVTRM